MKLPAVCRSVLLFLIALVSLAPAAPAQSQYLQNPAFANAVDASLYIAPTAAAPALAIAQANASRLQQLLNTYATVYFSKPGEYYFGSPTANNEGIIIPSNRRLIISPGATLWQHASFYGGSVTGHDYYALFRFAGSTKTTNVYIGGGGRIGRDTPAGADDCHLVRFANYDNLTLENITFYRKGNSGKYCFYSSYGKNLTIRNCRALGNMNEMLASPAVDSLGYACKSDGFHLSGFHDGVRMETSGSSGDNLNAFLSDEGADYSQYWGQYDRKGSIRNCRLVSTCDRSAEPIRIVGQSYDMGITGADWTASTKTITKAGAFAGYWLPGSIIRPTGTGVTAGEYLVLDQTGDDSIVLATSLAAGNLSGTVNIDAPTLAVTGATYTASTKTITKTSAFSGVAAGDWVRIAYTNHWDIDARVASSTANTIVLVDSINATDISSIAVSTGRTFQPVLDVDVDGMTGSLKVGALSMLATIDDGNLNGARIYLRAKNIKCTRADAAVTLLKLTASGLREISIDGVEVPDDAVGVRFGYSADCDRVTLSNIRSTQTANARHLFQFGSAPRSLTIDNCELNSVGGTAHFIAMGGYLAGGTDLFTFPRVKISNSVRRGDGTGSCIYQYGYGPAQVLDGQVVNCTFEGAYTRFLAGPPNSSPAVDKRSTWQVDNCRFGANSGSLINGQIDAYFTNWVKPGTSTMSWVLNADTNLPTASFAPTWITYALNAADINAVGTGANVDITFSSLAKFANVPTKFRNSTVQAVRLDWSAAVTASDALAVNAAFGNSSAPTQMFSSIALHSAADSYIYYPTAGLTAAGTADQGWINADWQPTLRISHTAGQTITAGKTINVSILVGGTIGSYN